MARKTGTVTVEFLSTAGRSQLPRRATPGAACFDLVASADVLLRSGRISLVPTGLRLRSPPGTFLEVRPRSGLASRGVLMANAPGTIDRDYAGEVFVPLTYLFRGQYRIRAGDRVAQVRLVEETRTTFRRGRVRPVAGRSGGFGSTGR